MEWWEKDEEYQPGISIFRGMRIDPPSPKKVGSSVSQALFQSRSGLDYFYIEKFIENIFLKLTVLTEDNTTAESNGQLSPVHNDCVRVCGQL